MNNLILVTCYTSPDIDGFACAVAYSEFLTAKGQAAVPGIFGSIHDEAKFIMDKFGFMYPTQVNVKDFSQVILVDTSTLAGMNQDIVPEQVIEIIDHRKIHDGDKFPNAKLQIEMVGSAAALIAEKFKHAQLEPSRMARYLLYGAIVSNTLNFNPSQTTERDIDAAEWLATEIEGAKELAKEMFIAKSDVSGQKLFVRMEGEYAQFNLSKKFGIVQLEVLEARSLAEDRKTDIESKLLEIKNKHGLDFIFATIIGLDEDTNVFIAPDPKAQDVLARALGLNFSENVAARPGLIMRKEIVPLLQTILLNN